MHKNYPHGIDITAPGGITKLMDFHRLTFGNAVMEDGAGSAVGDGAAAAAGTATGTEGAAGSSGTEAGTDAGAEAGQQAAAESVDQLPPWAQKIIRDTRKEAGDNRTAKSAAEADANAKIKAALTALGISDDTEDPLKAAQAAADTAAKERDTAKATARDTAAELIVWRHAKDLGVNPAALTDSKAFEKAIKDLDPTDPQFGEAVKTAAKTAAEHNPILKQAPAAGASGADFTGGTREISGIDAQIATAEKAGDHAKAISLKRQKAYNH